MVKQKKSPAEQKAKLVSQLKAIEKKIVDFDNQRAIQIGNLAKRYRLVDLSDEILEKELKAIYDKYKRTHDPLLTNMDADKKKS